MHGLFKTGYMELSVRPLVNICIPTYNHAQVIGDALRSAMTQSYDNLEILVLDNHSEDDTEQAVAKISAADPRVHYLRQPENVGIARNFSACVSLAHGQYVKLLCADDVLEPGCIEAMVRVMESHPEVALVGCARRVTDAHLKPQRVARARARFAVIEGKPMIRECFSFGNRIGEPTAVMFRREAGKRGFNASYSQLIDLEMWFHLLLNGNFAFLPEPLCSIRQHAQQATKVNLRLGYIVEDKRRLFREFAPALVGSMTSFQKCLWDMRMAFSLARTHSAGKIISPQLICEVFYKDIFAHMTFPLVAAFTRVALVRR